MILCSGLELKKNQIVVSKHFGVLSNITGGSNNARVWVKTVSSTAMIVCLDGVSINCDGLSFGMTCSVVVFWWFGGGPFY